MAACNDNTTGYIIINNISYFVTQINGQRLLKLQDEDLIPPPPRGTEIFVGKLPRNFKEQDLIRLFIQIGPIYKLRLMVDFNGRNRGYAFIKYFHPEAAQAAIAKYHQYEVYNGCRIGVYKSVDNCRLFVGNVPRNVTKKEMSDAFAPYAEGLKNIILYKSIEDPTQNRGFAFLEFKDHRSAAMTRRKLAPGTFIVWDTNILVDWADPIPEVDPKIMSTVKKLYIRNLDLAMTNENLKDLLNKLLGRYANFMAKVYKTQDYAFVHFETRAAAETALAIIHANVGMFGEEVEVMWARPKIYSKACRVHAFTDTFCTSLPPQNRRIVHMRQRYARMRIDNNNPHQLAQYHQQQNAGVGAGRIDVNNNYIRATVQPRNDNGLLALPFRSNL